MWLELIKPDILRSLFNRKIRRVYVIEDGNGDDANGTVFGCSNEVSCAHANARRVGIKSLY